MRTDNPLPLEEKDIDPRQADSQRLNLIYVLACFGMFFQIALELFVLYGLELSLQSYMSLGESYIARMLLFLSWLLFSVFAMFRANSMFRYWFQFQILGVVCLVPALLVSFLGYFFGEIPFLVSIIVWCFFGVGTGLIILGWYTFLSTLPTKETVTVFAFGSLLGTLPFLFLASNNNILLSLIGGSIMILGSSGMLFLLSKICHFEESLSREEFNSSPSLTIQATSSICMHSVLFAFAIATLFSMGVTATLIGVASGMVGGFLTFIMNRIERTRSTDIGFVQRIALPPLTICILLIPMLSGTGRLLCCCVVNAFYALFVTSGFGRIIVENAEFSLNPVKRLSEAKTASLIGFCLGSVIGYLVYFVNDVSDHNLMLTSIILTGATVTAFSLYISDDFRTRRELESLFISDHGDNNGGEAEQQILPRFRICCGELALAHELSQREGEVLVLLAKGRNANYIQKKLYITNATARTHIYHIYRKLGITSQQQLMDMVENHKPQTN